MSRERRLCQKHFWAFLALKHLIGVLQLMMFSEQFDEIELLGAKMARHFRLFAFMAGHVINIGSFSAESKAANVAYPRFPSWIVGNGSLALCVSAQMHNVSATFGEPSLASLSNLKRAD